MTPRRLYADLHWGATPPSSPSRWLAPDPRAGVLVELGALTAIEYETDKRGDGVSIYRHEFGDAIGRGCPVLAVTPDRRLVIAGGRYRVRRAGIVG